MTDFSYFLNQINISNEKFLSSSMLCTFYLSKINYTNGYHKDVLKKFDVNFLNFLDFYKNVKSEEMYENAFFNMNTEVDYDNKTVGGRIIFKTYNTTNSYESTIIDNKILSKILDNKTKKNIPFIQRGYFTLCYLLMIKNLISQDNTCENLKQHKLYEYINSFEGIILQKENTNNIKIIIHINKNFVKDDLCVIMNLIKEILHIKKNITLRYSGFAKNNQNCYKNGLNRNQELYY